MNSIMKKNMPGKVALAALFLLLPPIMTAVGFNYGILVACVAMLYTIAASGLDIDFGYCGQISMGHAAFFAIGAYGSVMLNKYFGLPSCHDADRVVLATIVGAIIAYPPRSWCSTFCRWRPSLREIVYTLLLNSPGGAPVNAVGLFAPSISIFGLELATTPASITLVCGVCCFSRPIPDGQFQGGRAWIAIRENPSPRRHGHRRHQVQVMAFAVSAFYTGLRGPCTPTDALHPAGYLTQKQSGMFVTMMLFGVPLHRGPIVGVVVVLMLIEVCACLSSTRC